MRPPPVARDGARSVAGGRGRRANLWRWLAVAAGGLGALAWILAAARAQPAPPLDPGPGGGSAPTAQAGMPGGGAGPGGAGGGGQPGTGTAAPPSNKIRVVFKTVPPTQATVSWGKKRLGIIKPKVPLVVERNRDSGPLDVVVHAEGCLPVHSRVYTFTDSVLAVKVTPLDKKNTLFGYKEAPPPEEDAGASAVGAAVGDAGMP